MVLDNFIKNIVEEDYKENGPLKNINSLYNNLLAKTIEEESKEKTKEEVVKELIKIQTYTNKLEAWIFAKIMEKEGD